MHGGDRRATDREEHLGVLPPVKDWCGGVLRSPQAGERTSRIQPGGETSPQTTPGRFVLGTWPHVLGQRRLGPGNSGAPLHACLKGEKSQMLTTPGASKDGSSRSFPQLLAEQTWPPLRKTLGPPDRTCSSQVTQHSRSCAVASGDRELTFTQKRAHEVHSSPQPGKPPRGPSVGAAPTLTPPDSGLSRNSEKERAVRS